MNFVINQQKPEALHTDQSFIEYIEIFPTIQGEGPHSGLPAIFLRLAGCNIRCRACDTQYTEGRKKVEVGWVAEQLLAFFDRHPCRPILVITGGEPFRQGPALWKLVSALTEVDAFPKVQIETNGTIPWRSSLAEFVTPAQLEAAGVDIVVSPKGRVAHWFKDLGEWDSSIITWKYVLTHEQIDPIDGLPTHVLGSSLKPDRPVALPQDIYIQPADLKDDGLNKLNLQACVNSSQQFGYRLSVQVHKLAGIA
jgi:7-carboxy-7-deazaguanine synthase